MVGNPGGIPIFVVEEVVLAKAAPAQLDVFQNLRNCWPDTKCMCEGESSSPIAA